MQRFGDAVICAVRKSKHVSKNFLLLHKARRALCRSEKFSDLVLFLYRTRFNGSKSWGSRVHALLLLSRVTKATKTKTCAKCCRSPQSPSCSFVGPRYFDRIAFPSGDPFQSLSFPLPRSWVMLGDVFVGCQTKPPKTKKHQVLYNSRHFSRNLVLLYYNSNTSAYSHR